MKALTFPCPGLLDERIATLATALALPRRAVLQAAARAAVFRPPLALIGYTDERLHSATRTVTVSLHPELHRAARAVAEHHFYNHPAWLFWWAMAHIQTNELVHFARADAATLAAFDARAYEHWTGGHPCLIPATARAPRPPRRPRNRTHGVG